jgi:hypothetical protein
MAAHPHLLIHNVYFSLNDRGSEARTQLMDACRKYLASHPGVVFFAVGVLAEELRREVNDLDFDVGLHIVFADQTAHDRYQDAPEHLRFIEEHKANWKRVRVFDSSAPR